MMASSNWGKTRVAVHSTNGFKPMQPISIATVSSLAFIAGISFWSAPGRAQGLCYLVDDNGRTINLEHMCDASNETPRPPSQPQSQVDGEPTAAESAEETAPAVRRFRIIGTPVEPDAATEETTEPADEAALEEAGETSDDSAPEADTLEADPVDDEGDTSESTSVDEAPGAEVTPGRNNTPGIGTPTPEAEPSGEESEV